MYFECVVEVEEILHLVVRDAAVDHRLLARVHDDERKLNKNCFVIFIVMCIETVILNKTSFCLLFQKKPEEEK